MSLICVGVDASKGYADFYFQNDAGSVLPPSRRYDDTPAGHAGIRQAFAQLHPWRPGKLLLRRFDVRTALLRIILRKRPIHDLG